MPSFNYQRAALVLVEAAFSNDVEIARKHGISDRVIRMWRSQILILSQYLQNLLQQFHLANLICLSDFKPFCIDL